MMRGPVVRQLCLGKYRETNIEMKKILDDEFHAFFHTLTVLLLFLGPVSNVFKALLEAYRSYTG